MTLEELELEVKRLRTCLEITKEAYEGLRRSHERLLKKRAKSSPP
jgi:hypothetical protein